MSKSGSWYTPQQSPRTSLDFSTLFARQGSFSGLFEGGAMRQYYRWFKEPKYESLPQPNP
jgi:hypothetical protein